MSSLHSPPGPGDAIQLASPLDPSEQPLPVTTALGNVEPLDAAELTAARYGYRAMGSSCTPLPGVGGLRSTEASMSRDIAIPLLGWIYVWYGQLLTGRPSLSVGSGASVSRNLDYHLNRPLSESSKENAVCLPLRLNHCHVVMPCEGAI